MNAFFYTIANYWEKPFSFYMQGSQYYNASNSLALLVGLLKTYIILLGSINIWIMFSFFCMQNVDFQVRSIRHIECMNESRRFDVAPFFDGFNIVLCLRCMDLVFNFLTCISLVFSQRRHLGEKWGDLSCNDYFQGLWNFIGVFSM